MAHEPKALQAVFEAAAPPDLELSFRPMFGGIMAYAAGRPFASFSRVGLALKMAGEDHAALAAVKGAKPLQYAPDMPVSKTYLLVPAAMLKEREALRGWIGRAARGAPAVKKRKKA